MSVTIMWRPMSEVSSYFEGGTSDSIEKLKTAVGDQIGPEDIKVLRAMAMFDPFFAEVADIVERHGAIKIWEEW